MFHRTILAAALDWMRIPQLSFALARAGRGRVTVLTYHRIADRRDGAALDDGVVDASPQQFDRHLAFVKRWFDVVCLDEVVAFACGRAPLPRRPLLVTFDDGYRDNHDVALPILRRHGVRATFFVATGFIEGRRPFWWDRVCRALKRCTSATLELGYPEELRIVVASEDDRRRAIDRVLRIVKERRGLDVDRFVEEVERAAGTQLASDDVRRLADQTVMTWQHARDLLHAGMDVQSHTRTHRVLQTLDEDETLRELRGSREDLERALGVEVCAVAYPVGHSPREDARIRRAVHAAGYSIGFSNGTGVSRIDAFDPLDVRRVALDGALPESFFRATLAFPRLGYGP